MWMWAQAEPERVEAAVVNDITIPVFYGLCSAAALALALASQRELLTRLAWLLLGAWAACNAMTIFIGFHRAPLLIPLIDAMLALCVPLIAAKSKIASVVFGLFVVVAIVHVDAFLTHTEGRPSYYLTLNMLYLAQVVIVGGASGLACLADRPGSSRLVPWLRFGHARVDASERKGGA